MPGRLPSQGSLQLAPVYVPHPFYRTWIAVFVASLLSPPLLDAVLDRNRARVAMCALAMLLPYLSTRLDPQLRRKYMFEAVVARARMRHGPGSPSRQMPRTASEPTQHWLGTLDELRPCSGITPPQPPTSPPRAPPSVSPGTPYGRIDHAPPVFQLPPSVPPTHHAAGWETRA